MSCFRCSRHLLRNIQQKHIVKNTSRRSFTGVNASPLSRTLKLFGFAVGGATVIGFGYVVYCENEEQPKKKLVILGSGWGAVSLIKSLKPGLFDISVVSPQNYFLFTPLLPSVTVGTVEGRSITEPIRKILLKKHKSGATFYESECTRVDTKENKVECCDLTDIVGEKQEFSLDYDYLVVAIGAQTATYNIKGVQEHAHYLKDIRQAQQIRKNIIDSFETAMVPGQPEHEVKRLLHFVVVGGGPTGVEFAAELRDWIKDDLQKVYPSHLIDKSQITLVDGLNKILNTYSEEISRYTEDNFKKEGIDIITSAFVSSIDAGTISYKNAVTKELHSMPYGMCVWCAGIGPRPLTKQIQSELPEQNNRFGLITDHFMKVKNSTNIFSLGDCSTVQFKKFSEYANILLDAAGIENDVEISNEQFRGILDTGMKKYPHLCNQFKEMERSHANAPKEEGDIFSREKFVTLANTVDTKQTALPPTAQVAAQEGKYLGKLLTKHAEDIVNDETEGIAPFQYKHLGSFAYVGDNRAVLELPIIGSLKGLTTMWLWRGIYASECVSLRMRMLVAFDWTKAFIFGRDSSRI